MRALLPRPGPVDPAAAHAAIDREAPSDRPWVMVNMVASVDGSTALDGAAGGLGGPGDREVFLVLRALADVILVAAGTARAETYGPAKANATRRAERLARGQTEVPRIALVSRSLDLDPASRLFTEASERTLILTTTDADADRKRRLAGVAEVLEVGAGSVDLAAALGALHRGGARTVLCEGGGSLNGQMVEHDLIDELNVTYSPMMVGGGGPRVAVGGAEVAHRFQLGHLWEDDDFLFARYLRRR